MTEAFSEWLCSSELGQYLLQQEQAFYERAVADVFGFHAVQVGLPDVDLLKTNRIPWQCRVASSGNVHIICEPTQLPFETRSLDLLVLPHVLDFSPEPHHVLREVERVLMPEGRLIMTGFNPLSLWGVRRALEGRDTMPWNGQFLSLLRIRDWLTLLDLEPIGSVFMGYAPPFLKTDWINRFRFMEWAGGRWWPLAAGVYGIEAIKRQRGMRVIMPKWKAGKKSSALVVASGNERQHTHSEPVDEHV